MSNTKLLQVLASLSNKELRDFKSHLAKIQTRITVKDLFDYMYTYRKNWSHKKLGLAQISTALGYNTSSRSLSNRMSELYQILMKFLVSQALQSKVYSFEKELLELRIFESRGLKHLQDLKRKKLLKQLRKTQLDDEWTPLKYMLLYDWEYFSMNSHKIDPENEDMENCLSLLSDFNLSTQLKYACEILSRSQVLNKATDQHHSLFQTILSTKISPVNHYQMIYQATFKTLYYLEPEYFDTTLALLKEKEPHLSPIDNYKIFVYLINALAQRPKKQVQNYGQLLLDLYKFGLPRGFLTHDDKISRVTFLNIVDIACQMNDLEFAESLIGDYSDKLPAEHYECTTALAKAILHFTKDEYDQTLDCINTLQFSDLGEKFRANVLILGCLYQAKGDISPAKDKCISFRAFVHRNHPKLHQQFLLSVRHFVDFVQKLLQRKQPKDDLFSELAHIDPIIMRLWLEKVLQDYSPI